MAKEKDKEYRNEEKEDSKTPKGGKSNRGSNRQRPRKSGGDSAVAVSNLQLITGGNISYGYPVGTSFSDAGEKKGMQVATSAKSMPGILTYYLDPHVGVSDGPNSKLNLAAHRLYTSFVYANGRNPQYDVPDAMIIPLAVGQVAAFYTHAVRVYNVLNSFSAFNRLMPKALADAMLINYDDFKRHASDFAHWLEDYRLKLQSLFVPNNLPIINEWMSCFADVYADELDNPKSQLYLMVPSSVWIYRPTALTTGGSLQPWQYYRIDTGTNLPHLYTFEEFTGYADAMVDVLVYDQDVNKVMADIMLSYGPTSVQDLIPVQLGAPVEIKYDPVVQSTLHNSTPLNNLEYRNAPGVGEGGPVVTSAAVYQQDNVLYHTPLWSGSKLATVPAIGAQILDSPSVEISPVSNILLTRMSVLTPLNLTINVNSVRSAAGYWFTSGEDVAFIKPRSLGVYTVAHMGITSADGEEGFTYALISNYVPVDTTGGFNFMSIGIDKFAKHPIYNILSTRTNSQLNNATSMANFELKGWYGDVSFYTVITDEQLYKMHDTFVLAQLSAGLSD